MAVHTTTQTTTQTTASGRRGRRRARIVTAVMAAAAVGLAGCSATGSAPGDDPAGALAERLSSSVTGAGAGIHLEALQRIADASGGDRAAGSPGYARSVDYVAGVLREAGFEVTTPTYDAGQDQQLRNVVARTRGGDPGSVVLAGAHLDSVRAGPGINDDGTGVAALLETALRLGSSPGTANTVAFGFWGSEEDDLQGSTSYVDRLSSDEQDEHLLYLNVDMLGSLNGGYFVQGGAGDEIDETGPDGSAAVADVLTDELAATSGVRPETIPLYGDDDAAFVEAGIPVAGAVTGDSDDKTAAQAERWGGIAGEVYDPCYHSACDGLANIDRTKLDHYTTAIAATLARFTGGDTLPTLG